MTARRSLFVAVAIGLAVRLVNVHGMSRLPMAEYQFQASEADMALAYEWSGHILQGDVLGHEPVHQYTEWMRQIAPLETWERWWGGAHIFHQAPLYAYTLATFRLVGGDHFVGIALCQTVVGLCNVVLVFIVAERLFGGLIASVAALGAAMYAPFELHELLVLRDTLGVTVSLAMLWALVRCDDAAPGRWFVAGLLIGVATLCREATLFFVPLVVVWIAQRFRSDRRALARASVACFLGIALGLAPLVVRNVTVGAPAVSLSTRGLEAFIYGNAPGSAGFGWRLPPATASILEQADGRLGTAIRLTLADYHGAWQQFLGLQALKVRAIFAAYEATDNINSYYFADHLPFLGFSLHFEHVLALGLVGLCVGRARHTGNRVLVYFLASAVLSLMYSIVVGRYRLPAAAVLVIYAAVAVCWIAERILTRRWRSAVLAGAASAALILASSNLLAGIEPPHYVPREYSANAMLYYQRGDVDQACTELRMGLEKAYTVPDHGALTPQYMAFLGRPYANLAHTLHRDGEAVIVLERLASSFGSDAELEELIGEVYRDGLGRPDEAVPHFARAKDLLAHRAVRSP